MFKCYVLSIGAHWDTGNSVSLQFEAIARELVKRGNQVVILLPGQMTDKITKDGNPAIFTWPSKRPTKLQDAVFLFRIIRKYEPDCLISNFAAVNWMMFLGWLLRVKERIAWYHTTISAIELDNKENPLVKEYHLLRKSIIYRLSTKVIPVSTYVAENEVKEVFHVPDSKVQVFHNLLRDYSRDFPRSISKNKNKLTCVARMDPSKGHKTLINAMPLVVKRFPNAQLRLIGDGHQKQELELLVKELNIEDNVNFLGKVCSSDVILELARSYINIHPAQIDNCPLALIESIAVGTPVVASNTGGIPEIILDGINGILVQPNNAEELAIAICKILESPEIWKNYSDNAIQYFLSEFELAQGVTKIVNWLEINFEISKSKKGR